MRKKYQYLIIQTFGTIVALVGAITLLMYALGRVPKMAISTAVSFVLEGLAIIWLGNILRHGKN